MSKYESHNLEDSALPFIYKRSTVRKKNVMFPSSNWHENIEILYIENGDGYIYNNGQIIEVSKGDVAVINANHLHSIGVEAEDMRHSYLIIDRSFCIQNGIDTNAVSFDTKIKDEGLLALLSELERAYSLPEEAPYRTATVRSTVLRILLFICEKYSVRTENVEHTERSLSYVKGAIDYIRASYSKNFSLEDVANYVGVSKCYLSREFHKFTGMSFVAYVNRTRCKMAQRLLLEENINVYEVGNRCGFENRSYFAKTFQKYIGMLPIEYRESAKKSAAKSGRLSPENGEKERKGQNP